ncbi:BrnA antitoxin family protein [Roseovarius sp.]|uniref:BrnA antitoxin family protein n=1 Tax=Roseovarius sp. TaxID=1486281 RepID=UPI003B5CB1E7
MRRMPPPQNNRAALMDELRELQESLTEHWLDRSLPEEWQGLESREPIARPKTRVTIRLDSDMVKWFRRLGPGYGARINRVLRLYWLALIEGRVYAHWDENGAGPQFAEYLNRQMEMLKEQRARRRNGDEADVGARDEGDDAPLSGITIDFGDGAE